MFICIKNQPHPWLSWHIAKILQTWYFGYFGQDWPCPPKLIVSTCRKIWCLSACIKSSSTLPSFLRSCKDTANLLFWVLWTCLATPVKRDSINLWNHWCLPACKKASSCLTSFLKYRKDIVNFSGCFGMPDKSHQKKVSTCRKLKFIRMQTSQLYHPLPS